MTTNKTKKFIVLKNKIGETQEQMKNLDTKHNQSYIIKTKDILQ